MKLRKAPMIAVALVLPSLGLAQSGFRAPIPVMSPPPGAAPAPPGVLQGPQGMPSVESAVQHLDQKAWNEWYYQIFTIPKKKAVVVGPNRVRPSTMMPQVYEIVDEVGDNYLIRNLPPEDPTSLGHRAWLRQQAREAGGKEKAEYLKDKYLLVDSPVMLPPFTDKLRFVAADAGLPKGGRWQMSFDIADMNGDGLLDLVFGPQRTGEGSLVPYVFMQQKDHSWRLVRSTWPTSGIKLDYGSVRVADFDGDGNQDIAIACHMSKTYVLYGDGKGDFTRFVTIPQTTPEMTSRSLVVADFNNDGRPDIATYAETDLNMATVKRLGSGLVNVALNLPSGWKAAENKGFPDKIMGDSLTAADLDGDGRMDLILTSRSLNIMELLFRNLDSGNTWQPIAVNQMPVYGYVYATAAGSLDRFKQPDVLSCFEQHNPWKSEPPVQTCVIYRFHDAAGVPTTPPTPTVLFLEKGFGCIYQAAAIGDIDGDGRNDIVVASNTGLVRVFLQGLEGQFYEQRHAGLDKPGTSIMAVRIADLYHDGKGEVVFAGAPTKEGGGIWVYRPERLGGGQKPKTP